MAEKDHSEQLEETQETPAPPAEEAQSRLLFIFKGRDMVLDKYAFENVTADQLLYLANWLDWYAKLMKNDEHFRKAMNQIAVPGEPGPPLPRIARPNHGALVSNHGDIRP